MALECSNEVCIDNFTTVSIVSKSSSYSRTVHMFIHLQVRRIVWWTQ